jgi:hypothetical protein
VTELLLRVRAASNLEHYPRTRSCVCRKCARNFIGRFRLRNGEVFACFLEAAIVHLHQNFRYAPPSEFKPRPDGQYNGTYRWNPAFSGSKWPRQQYLRPRSILRLQAALWFLRYRSTHIVC